MKSRVLVFATLIILIAAGAYVSMGDFGALQGTDSGGAARAETLSSSAETADGAQATQTPLATTRNRVDWDLLNGLSGKSDGKGFSLPKPTDADIAQFLRTHGENAANLTAAWRLTRDRKWLERALELFPKHPMVLLAALQALPAEPESKQGDSYRPSKERMDLIERLKSADPNNPLPWIFSAQELFKSKDTEAAVAEVRAALERPAFYTYSAEEAAAGQHLFESLGMGSLEASIASLYGVNLPHASAAVQTSRSLMDYQKAAAESGNNNGADDAMRLTYGLGRMFATPEASRFLIGQLVGMSMEKRVLDALPDGSRPAWLHVNPAQRLAELEKQKLAVKEAAANSEWLLQTRDEALISDYIRRVRTQGELAAQDFLKTRKPPMEEGVQREPK